MLVCVLINQILFLAVGGVISKYNYFQEQPARLTIAWVSMVVSLILAGLFVHLIVVVVANAIKRRPLSPLFQRSSTKIFNTEQLP